MRFFFFFSYAFSFFIYLIKATPSNLSKPENKPQKTIDDLKKEAEATQGKNAKIYDESLIEKVNFDFRKIEEKEIFKEVIIGNKNSQVAELITKLNNSDWVKQGKEFVKEPQEENEICPFCQKKTITKNLWGCFYKIDKERDSVRKKRKSVRINHRYGF